MNTGQPRSLRDAPEFLDVEFGLGDEESLFCSIAVDNDASRVVETLGNRKLGIGFKFHNKRLE